MALGLKRCMILFILPVAIYLATYVLLGKRIAPLRIESLLNKKNLIDSDDKKNVAVHNPGCISRKLIDYKPTKTSVVYHHPDIVHYVMISQTPQYQLVFRDYISMVSVYKFLKPKKIMLHTNADIVGGYWKSMQEWKSTKVEINKVERVPMLSNVKVNHVEHEADYTKVKLLDEIGGTILDFDVIMINGTMWRQNQMISECVLSIEETQLNIGAISCVKGSSFAKKWLNKYHTDYQQGWLYNSGQVQSNLLKVADTDNTCYNVYVDETAAQDPLFDIIRWVDDKRRVNWRSKSAAHYYYTSLYHLTPLKKEDLDERLLMQDSALGDLFRHVVNAY